MTADNNLLCRICANINQINDDIFGNNSEMPELIFKYLSISIDTCDEISTKICHNCKEKIYNFHDFALQCERAQRFLITNKKDIIKDFNCVQNLKSEFEVEVEVKEENKYINSDDDHYVDADYFESAEEIIENEIKKETDPLKKLATLREKRKRLTVIPKKRKKEKPSSSKEEKTVLPIEYEKIDDLDNSELHNDVLKINGKSINIKKEKITDIGTINDILEFSKNNDIDIKDMNLSRRSLKKAYMCKMFKFNCHMCDLKFNDWNSLESHTKTKHKTNPEVICICMKKLCSAQTLRTHWNKHNPDNRWRCNLCSKSFGNRTTYNTHMSVHKKRGSSVFSCEECEKKFHDSDSLERHKKMHLPQEERLWDCKLCDWKFRLQTHLKKHVQAVHEKLRPFVCDTCGCSFNAKATLIEHNLTHTEEMNFICDICNKAFKAKKRLKRHMLSHSTVKYPCPHCPVILSRPGTLKTHLLIHDENIHHPCPFCDKTFKRKKDVASHIKLHTGERPYSCLWCPRTFSHASNYNIHKRRMHPIESQGQEKSRFASDKIREKPITESLKVTPQLKREDLEMQGKGD